MDFNEIWIGLWILAVLLLAGTGLLLAARWDEIPERFPVHWNTQGEPDAWAERSPGSVASPLFLGAGVCAFLALLAWRVGGFARRVDGNVERDVLESRLLRDIFGAVAFGLALLSTILAVQPLRSQPEELPRGFGWWIAAGIAVLLGFVFWRSSIAARRLEAIAPRAAEERELWRWGGVIYVNPDDSRLFVPKRLGLGWTLNFGRPVSWLVLAVLLLPVVLVLLPLLAD